MTGNEQFDKSQARFRLTQARARIERALVLLQEGDVRKAVRILDDAEADVRAAVYRLEWLAGYRPHESQQITAKAQAWHYKDDLPGQ